MEAVHLISYEKRDESYQQEAKRIKMEEMLGGVGWGVAVRFRRCRWHLPKSLWAAVSQQAQSQHRIFLNWFGGVSKSCALPPAIIYLMGIICLFHIKHAHGLLTFSFERRLICRRVRALQASLCRPHYVVKEKTILHLTDFPHLRAGTSVPMVKRRPVPLSVWETLR